MHFDNGAYKTRKKLGLHLQKSILFKTLWWPLRLDFFVLENDFIGNCSSTDDSNLYYICQKGFKNNRERLQ